MRHGDGHGSDSEFEPAAGPRVDDTLPAASAGHPILGAGSATALCGAIAARLVASVARLTLAREAYRDVWPEVDAIRREADETVDRLQKAAADDGVVFGEIVAARRRRDAAASDAERQRWAHEAVLRMAPAIRLPLHTATLAVRVTEMASRLADRGLRSAGGDSTVAAALALSAADGSLFIVDQNLAASDGAHGELRAAAAAVRAHVAGIRALISRPIER